jgi:two-component system, chemotaxis family, response regulator Rcp1
MRLIIIEDNPADVRLFREALRVLSMDVQVSHFSDVESAVAVLRAGTEPWQPPPDAVFLDLNMPRMSGFDVLEILRDTPGCDNVPIVIFTSSHSPADMEKASELKADGFVHKPTELRDFFAVVGATVQALAP